MGDAMKEKSEHWFRLHEEILVEPASGSAGFRTNIVGFKPGEYLIVDSPSSQSPPSELRINDKMRVRCFQHGACRFETRIRHLIQDPTPLLFLDYPHSVEEIDRRGSERKKIFIRGTYLDLLNHKGRRSWEGYILDISDSGCLMWGDFVHLVDREIMLSFQVPWTGEKIQAKARVMRCEVTDKGILSGLKFTAMDSENRGRLDGLISSLKDDQLSRLVNTKP